MFPRPIPILSLVFAALALVACGGDEPSTTAEGVPGDTVAAKSPAAADRGKSAAPEGHCALISTEEIEAAFPMALKLGKPRVIGRVDNPTHACEVQLGIGEVGQLTFGTTTEGLYNEYAKYLQQSSTTSRQVEGLGEDAFLLNNAQLLVRRADGQFLNVAVNLLVFGELPLTQEQMGDAVIELGTMLDERLGG
ncbi:MAG: hypothetical protein V2I57_14090 [Xanthomonadales bacterium]|jgi:hypothetical protein|nr:hypothetical protein [Xanthomonadales bacterium]